MKLLRIFIISIVIICIASLVGLVLVNNMANKLIDESIADLMDNNPIGINTTQIDNISNNNVEFNNPIENNKPIDTSVNSTVAANNPDKASSETSDGQVQTKPVEKPVIPTAEVMTSKEIKNASDGIPVKEKLEVTKMVVSKLSGSEISMLSAMATGGISSEEKKKAKELVYSRFTPQEIEYIKSLYYKYVKGNI